jgi:hypothetical protein
MGITLPGTGETVATELNEQGEKVQVVTDNILAALLLRVVALLSSPRGYDKSQGRQRGTVVLESGTLTTCGTLTTLSQIGGRDAAQMLLGPQSRQSWALNHRSRIS